MSNLFPFLNSVKLIDHFLSILCIWYTTTGQNRTDEASILLCIVVASSQDWQQALLTILKVLQFVRIAKNDLLCHCQGRIGNPCKKVSHTLLLACWFTEFVQLVARLLVNGDIVLKCKFLSSLKEEVLIIAYTGSVSTSQSSRDTLVLFDQCKECTTAIHISIKPLMNVQEGVVTRMSFNKV